MSALVPQGDAEIVASFGATNWLVLSGDWGGQVYVTVPLSCLGESLPSEAIDELLEDLDQGMWSCNEGSGAQWDIHGLDDRGPLQVILVKPFRKLREDFFPRLEGWRAVGEISGGMGGGLLLDGEMWVHNSFLLMGLEYVNSMRTRLGLAPLETLELMVQ